MRDHTKLRAFELADEVALLIYRITREFPKEEIYGLTSQMRRAAISVPSKIVGGCARESQAEYLRFLEIAFGSLRERIISSVSQSAWDIVTSMVFLTVMQKSSRPRRFSAPSCGRCDKLNCL